MRCRNCETALGLRLIDLGAAPPSNAYLTEENLREPEKWFPLKVGVCESCWLVQTEDVARPSDLFDRDYAYFSSYSQSWLQHCKAYVTDMVLGLSLDADSHVLEIASNDGYLLQHVKAHGIPCTGVEPTASTAAAARAKGIPVVEAFFGVGLATELAAQGKQADLMVANNVLAHVPDIRDFVSGFRLLLKPHGIATFEFPHLMRLVTENQFDTIYHEHYSYLSLSVVDRVTRAAGLQLYKVEELATHGGSLRVFVQRADTGCNPCDRSVDNLLHAEAEAGLQSREFYEGFQRKAEQIKDAFLAFLLEAKREGKVVAAYGAAAKGNTLLNFAGVRSDLLKLVADRNPAKQGKFLPGSRIPIVDESQLADAGADFVVILPWNLKAEVMEQLDYLRSPGRRFVTVLPTLNVT